MNQLKVGSLAPRLGMQKTMNPQQKLLGTESLKVSENKLGLRRANQDATSDEKLADRLTDRPLRGNKTFQRAFSLAGSCPHLCP